MDVQIFFQRLFRNQMDAVVDIQLNRLRDRLAHQNIGLQVDRGAVSLVADLGYDQVYGARPIKRAIQKYIEDPMALLILEDKLRAGDLARVSSDQSKLFINDKEIIRDTS